MAIRWLGQALDDLDAIERYIHADNPPAAHAIQARIVQVATLLGSHPHLGRPGRVAGTSELVVTGTPYVIAYAVRDQDAVVLAVIHGARMWPDAL